MCGRSRCTLTPHQIELAAGTSKWVDQNLFTPSYNISPGKFTPAVYRSPSDDGTLTIHSMKWGLIPAYTKQNDKPDHYKMFNARSETLAEKHSFRPLISKKRCIVYVNGFYEWKKESPLNKKQPYYIHLSADQPMPLAALYDSWHDLKNNTYLYTYTILTTDSSKKLQWLHDRMPVILRNKEEQDIWLDIGNENAMRKLQGLMKPYNEDDLLFYRVTPEMNNPKFDSPKCSQELKELSVASFFNPSSSPTMQDESLKKGRNKEKKEDGQRSPDNEKIIVKTMDSNNNNINETPKKKVIKSPTSLETKKGVKVALPPLSKRKRERPPDQPAISSFFTKKS